MVQCLLKNNSLQELKDLSCDFRKNKKLIIFSTGWTKKKFHQAGFLQKNLSFWPSVKVVYRFYIQTCFEMYVCKNIATLHRVFLYNEVIDILTLLKLFTIDLDFLEVKSTKNV